MVQLTRKYDAAMAADSGEAAGEAPPSSAERMKTLRAYTGAATLPPLKAEAKGKPAAKVRSARAAKPRRKTPVKPQSPAPVTPETRDPSPAKKRSLTSRKDFVKTHRPRRHATGPEPMLSGYETDIRKMLKKGYSAADIYHWLHDYRFEAVSRRTVQRFVKSLCTDV